MMVLLVPMLFLLLAASGVAEGQITVANQGTVNPTLLYRGKPVFKIGPLPEVVPFAVQWGSNDFPHERWLDWMHGHRLGYGRVYPESGYPWVPCDADKRLFPFKVIRRQNSRPIVDLDEFDSAYWDNFARVIKECADRDIILQMQIYQRVFFEGKSEKWHWQGNYFHPDNNVNEFPTPTGRGGYPLWKAMTQDTVWRRIHRRWVEHILDSVGDSGNVIIDLMNEGAFKNQLTREWIEFTLDVIEQWERKTGNDILVGMDFDHFYKKQDPGLAYVLSHPRMDLIICEGSEAHVVRELVAGDRRPLEEELALDYRRRYRKPIISTNSPGYSVDENPSVMRLYQWYSLMMKVQGVGVYAKTYPLDFASPAVGRYARESKILMQFFDTLQDYVALAPVPERIEKAPSKYRGLLASTKEVVVYLHTEEFGERVAAGEELVLTDLELPDGPVSIRFVDPSSGESTVVAGRLSDGRLAVRLPEFFEGIAIHVVQNSLTSTGL